MRFKAAFMSFGRPVSFGIPPEFQKYRIASTGMPKRKIADPEETPAEAGAEVSHGSGSKQGGRSWAARPLYGEIRIQFPAREKLRDHLLNMRCQERLEHGRRGVKFGMAWCCADAGRHRERDAAA